MQTTPQNTNSGKHLKQWFKRTLGCCLKEERQNRHLDIDTIARTLHTKTINIHNAEQGIDRIQWHTLARLLLFYKKDIEITLTDIKMKK